MVAVVEMFTVSDTGPIGCIMNVLATVSFCCTASFVYKKMHTKRGAVVGLSLAVVVLTAEMCIRDSLHVMILVALVNLLTRFLKRRKVSVSYTHLGLQSVHLRHHHIQN